LDVLCVHRSSIILPPIVACIICEYTSAKDHPPFGGVTSNCSSGRLSSCRRYSSSAALMALSSLAMFTMIKVVLDHNIFSNSFNPLICNGTSSGFSTPKALKKMASIPKPSAPRTSASMLSPIIRLSSFFAPDTSSAC